MKLNTQTREAITMAHDTSLVLSLLAQKIQSGADIDKEDLQSIPALSQYASRVMKALLDAVSEEPEVKGQKEDRKPPFDEGQKEDRLNKKRPPRDWEENEDVREGEVE